MKSGKGSVPALPGWVGVIGKGSVPALPGWADEIKYDFAIFMIS
ncbi:MAG: hypothetical protein AB7G68_13380 [Nitrospiraceae bacterium]